MTIWDGEIDAEEVRAHIARLAGDATWLGAHRYLTDLTSVSFRPTDARLGQISALFREHLAAGVGTAPWAVVAGPAFEQALVFGIHVEADIPRMLVFSSLEPACSWLGVAAAAVAAALEELRGEARAR